ncbi:hypothetical protein EMIHUDRAFT_312799 [Emiliania huxleyi CCMP1516]|uniref:Uncharacterized protein n=2 Tax=Emiliania huxleyi TaxID=2903 RepID=A0A0D3KY78_EMIH1|nr:hypothetical protein EMIHUDRAFT_309391 [Emiliania huxleyi CCMP1516]XP_005793142.1 hypothetical protein EMIHUDRAFT_312799 [Emiliania huxleyi CCMP1516]EOD35502.1 hypothetical protein EMIHUDRAFT_309391 [Emiliania huxleyi CCMP1516]EOD40713.1 hypothetical protein EMIHUDRAFT_312799 [Emiliania huxleyi CCMP1516]|eukprot:XP_005787931.1 hypothetical protein EMIHUDRAFT_309391 [Emiliania huxleyi CCMP1516]
MAVSRPAVTALTGGLAAALVPSGTIPSDAAPPGRAKKSTPPSRRSGRPRSWL